MWEVLRPSLFILFIVGLPIRPPAAGGGSQIKLVVSKVQVWIKLFVFVVLAALFFVSVHYSLYPTGGLYAVIGFLLFYVGNVFLPFALVFQTPFIASTIDKFDSFFAKHEHPRAYMARAKKFIAFSVSVIVVLSILVVFGTVLYPQLKYGNFRLLELKTAESISVVWIIVFTILTFGLHNAHLQVQLMFGCTTALLRAEFSRITQIVKKLSRSYKSVTSGSVEHVRAEFEEISELMDRSSVVFRHLLGPTLGACLVNLCLTAYTGFHRLVPMPVAAVIYFGALVQVLEGIALVVQSIRLHLKVSETFTAFTV